jgi:predicted outer membrane repeat protein
MEANALAGLDVIRIPTAGTYSLTITGTDDVAAVGDLDITQNVTIVGATGVVVDASALGDRSFDIRGAYTVKLNPKALNYCGGSATTYSGAVYSNGASIIARNLLVNYGEADYGGGFYLMGGSLEVSGTTSRFTSNSARGMGGAIYSYGGDVTIQNASFTSNSLVSGSGSNGSAITVSTANLDLSDSIFTNNQGVSSCGATIFLAGSTTSNIVRSTFDSNDSTEGHAGAIHYYGDGPHTIEDSVFQDNTSATYGGAIYSNGQVTLLDITGSTFSGNSAVDEAGAIYSERDLRITNSTISGNSASRGGAIYSISSTGNISFNNVTVTQNTASNYGGGLYTFWAGTSTLRNTIIAENTATTGGSDCYNSGTITSSGYNLIGDIDDCSMTLDATDQYGDSSGSGVLDPELDVLADNGGDTWTHALLSTSPAINAGDPAGCTDADGIVLTYDQRGSPYSRTVGSACDIGAYEYQ